MKTRYDNEKVIFGHGIATTKITDPQRDFVLFFGRELDKIVCKNINIKLLDVGCGAGNKTKMIKNRYPNLSICACDLSKNAIKEAKNYPGGVNFIVADATKLPYKNNEFNVVVMNSVLDHTNNPGEAINEVARVLKKGGVFLVTSPLEADLTTIHGWLTKYVKSFRGFRNDKLGHNFAFDKKTLLNKMKISFRVDKTEYSWFYFAQAIDLIYYPILAVLGKNPDESIDNYINENSAGTSNFLKQTRKTFAFVQNLENLLFKNILPGYFIYIKAVKK